MLLDIRQLVQEFYAMEAVSAMIQGNQYSVFSRCGIAIPGGIPTLWSFRRHILANLRPPLRLHRTGRCCGTAAWETTGIALHKGLLHHSIWQRGCLPGLCLL